MATTRTASRPRIPVADQITVYLRKAKENPYGQGATPVSVRILAQDLGLSSETVYRTCRELAKRGLIQEIKVGGQFPFYRV